MSDCRDLDTFQKIQKLQNEISIKRARGAYQEQGCMRPFTSLLKCPNILTSVRPQIPLESDSYHFLNLKLNSVFSY